MYQKRTLNLLKTNQAELVHGIDIIKNLKTKPLQKLAHNRFFRDGVPLEHFGVLV
jgi:hypothetical protein